MFDVLPFISRRLPIVWQADVTIVSTYCTVAQGQLIIFLKLLSFCKDNRMNTELVIAYYTILQKKNKQKKQLVIFLIKSVFCEHVNKKGKIYITATYCKSNRAKRSN